MPTIKTSDMIRPVTVRVVNVSQESIEDIAEAVVKKIQKVQPEQKDPDWECISLLSEIRSKYNCFNEEERPYYEALSKAISAMRGE